MNYSFLAAILLLSVNIAAAQTGFTNDSAVNDVPVKQEQPYAYVPQMPDAGYDINKYVVDNIHYPDDALKHEIQGRVLVEFVINADGSISNCRVVKSLGGGCDEEAVRVVKNMPVWKTPGKKDGKNVRVLFSLPINFALTNQISDSAGKTIVLSDSAMDQVFTKVDQMPSSKVSLYKYISDNLIYPTYARRNNISGRVLIQFVVNEDGTISDCKVVKGIGGGCDEEALRVIKKMPPWNPGMREGKAVKIHYYLPISFNLTDNR